MSKEAPKQYLFVSNRDIVIRSTTGASVGFEKGVPTHVPRHMHSVVMEKGIMPSDEKGKVLDVEEAPVTPLAEVRVMVAPEDPVDRAKAVRAAIAAVLKSNVATDFTAGGTPHERAISVALGWRVDQREVKSEFQKMRSKED